MAQILLIHLANAINMEMILNYYCTKHFSEQIKRREISPLLVSLCLARGKTVKISATKREVVLNKNDILQAIKERCLNYADCEHVISCTVVYIKNRLITAYFRKGDIGICTQRIKHNIYVY